jgi:tRNA A37 threonylcarbamoyladenosine dehydratase
VGLGGSGSHVVQQLAYLGVANFLLIDDDTVTDSSLNRLIGAYGSDVHMRTPKTESAGRNIQLVAPSAQVRVLNSEFADWAYQPHHAGLHRCPAPSRARSRCRCRR